MAIVSVVIPYYQRKAGILRKALSSIRAQELPDDWSVEIHVIDDGSPHPASEELAEFVLGSRMTLEVHVQPNGGVAAARNKGLEKVSEKAALIAYIDSDDIWPSAHLRSGIQAYESGYDFYFCDNHRPQHHESYFEYCEGIQNVIRLGKVDTQGFIEIPKEVLPALVIQEFPTHASSVIHASSIAKTIRFSTRLRSSGEDVLYFASVSLQSRRACTNLNQSIFCGSGVNIYFNSIEWDNPYFMRIKRDQVIAYTLISRLPFHSELTTQVARKQLKINRSEFVYHLVRKLYRRREKVPQEFFDLLRFDVRIIFWFPFSLYRVLRYYKI